MYLTQVTPSVALTNATVPIIFYGTNLDATMSVYLRSGGTVFDVLLTGTLRQVSATMLTGVISLAGLARGTYDVVIADNLIGDFAILYDQFVIGPLAFAATDTPVQVPEAMLYPRQEAPVVSWAGGLATLLAVTNRYYPGQSAVWHVAASNIEPSAWIGARYGSSDAAYFRIISAPRGTYTAQVDVAKFAVRLAPGTQKPLAAAPGSTYVATPLHLFDRGLSRVMAPAVGALGPESATTVYAPLSNMLAYAECAGGAWSYSLPAMTTWDEGKGYIVVRSSDQTNTARLAFAGWVPTNSYLETTATVVRASASNVTYLVGTRYPAPLGFGAAGIQQFCAPGAAGQRCVVRSTDAQGNLVNANFVASNQWIALTPAITNCVPGNGYLLTLNAAATNAPPAAFRSLKPY